MHSIKIFLSAHRRSLLIGAGVLYIVIAAIQLIYPSDQLLPFARIDTLEVGGQKKAEVSSKLDQMLNEKTIPVIVANSKLSYEDVVPKSIGLTIANTDRVKALEYPFWARLIPTSILWYKNFWKEESPKYDRNSAAQDEFIRTTLGDCNLQPKDASLRYKDKKLEVVPAKDGGTCSSEDVKKELSRVSPTLASPSSIHLDVEVALSSVTTQKAEALQSQLLDSTSDGVKVKALKDEVTIPQEEVLSWLDFKTNKTELAFTINKKSSDSYFAKSITPKVLKAAGVTKVTTRDFTEVSRKSGASGRTLDTSATRSSVAAVLSKQKEQATALTTVLKPKVTYTRTYTKTSNGIAALIKHYDDDHPGVFGVSFRELGGSGRSAEHNGSKTFHTASTYKLFVAYGTLKKIEKNDWKWSDKILGSKTIDQCFEVMIVNSDNACAEALYKKIGYQKVINDVHALGMPNTTLPASGQRTSASDLAVFLSKLESGSIGLKASSRAKLLSAMKRNVYRQGIPTGASGQTADKVGFLWALLHDAAIVYSPKGTYVLAIMSDGSSWANIAELTRKIESLR
ncbi:MAG TPA: serine hydrolase [Candidatus Saccharimonadales bacterium]